VVPTTDPDFEWRYNALVSRIREMRAEVGIACRLDPDFRPWEVAGELEVATARLTCRNDLAAAERYLARAARAFVAECRRRRSQIEAAR
jgi:hypothetical protein